MAKQNIIEEMSGELNDSGIQVASPSMKDLPLRRILKMIFLVVQNCIWDISCCWHVTMMRNGLSTELPWRVLQVSVSMDASNKFHPQPIFEKMNSVTLGFPSVNLCLMIFHPAALGIITVHAESTGLASSQMMMGDINVCGILLPIIIEETFSLVFNP